MTSNFNGKLNNLSKTRKIILLMILVFIMGIAIWGVKKVYAFYYDSITTGILANKVGDFDLGDGDINIMIYRENHEGRFVKSASIPSAYYVFNDNLTACSIPCNDGSNKCQYTYNDVEKKITLTTDRKITCKYYFEKEVDSDINVFILVERPDGEYTNPDQTKKYDLIEKVPAYGYMYTDTYTCDSNATVTYNSESKKFSVTASGKNNCYVYFDRVGNADITVNVYVQESYGSSVYNNVSSIPANRLFTLNETKSTCTGGAGGAAISYTNGYIYVTTNEKQTCDVYLDLESN